MKKFLLALADKPTPQVPKRFQAYLDRYTRKGKHHDGKGMVPGWTLTAWLRARNEEWQHVREWYGLQAAIDLGF